jgi:hypothetical protein
MACDGDIAKEEVLLVNDITSKQESFRNINIEAIINDYVAAINEKGVLFLKQYLKELEAQKLSIEEQMIIIDLAIQTIYADSKIEYSEVKFFKKIRNRLSLNDEQILTKYPDIEDFLLPDINVIEDPEWNNVIFENINLAEYGQKQ